MRLESWKQRWVSSGGVSSLPASRTFSVDTESEYDEPADLQIKFGNSEPSSPEV